MTGTRQFLGSSPRATAGTVARMTTPPPSNVPPPTESSQPTVDAYPAPPADGSYTPVPAPKKSKLPLILAAAGAAVLLIAIAIGGTLWFVGRNDLTKEQAQRECRTAIEREAERRAGLGNNILVSMTGVELQETWETEDGWSVNGTANYTLTSALLGQTPTSVGLTCEAVATDDGVRTTVKNRL
ncbi:hypothetical protein FHU28_002334 [Micromonospora echinospora]|uniref:Uncharacterized protein n=1 Tax=Micromonospora echinospora TaxID=1877 RepID=A0ABR6MAU4_MICEC|nr:hypothetical protein [Micromonospora echinospora]MBB5112495.1 hypothetical protein [Micromonospora echinospora]